MIFVGERDVVRHEVRWDGLFTLLASAWPVCTYSDGVCHVCTAWPVQTYSAGVHVARAYLLHWRPRVLTLAVSAWTVHTSSGGVCVARAYLLR